MLREALSTTSTGEDAGKIHCGSYNRHPVYFCAICTVVVTTGIQCTSVDRKWCTLPGCCYQPISTPSASSTWPVWCHSQ